MDCTVEEGRLPLDPSNVRSMAPAFLREHSQLRNTTFAGVVKAEETRWD